MSRLSLPVVHLALIFALLLATPAATVVPGGFPDVVVFATNSVRVNSDTVITSGDVVANSVSPGPTLAGGGDFEVYLDRKASLAGNVKGNRVKIFNQTTVSGTVYYGQTLDNSGSIGGQSPGLAFPVFAPLPLFLTGPANGPDVAVPAGGTQTLAAGTYGNITIGNGGSLVLAGGTYNLRSIDGMDDVRVLFQGAAEVRVADKMRTRRRPTIGPAAGAQVGASNLVFYVAGINGTDGALGSTPEAVRIGSDGVLAANFYVPNGTLRFEVNTVARGAFLARDVQVDRGSRLTLDSYFRNRPPVAVDDVATVDEDSAVTVDVLANDSDPNQDNLTVTQILSAVNGAAVINADNTVTFAHDGSETTSASFTYQVCDDGVAPGPLCASANVAIVVNPINDPPTALDDSVTTPEDTSILIDVLANDSDADGNLVPSSVTVLDPNTLLGTVQVNPSTGAISYSPSLDFFGTESFAYQVCDDGFPTPPLCSTATVTVTVTAVNDAPVAEPQDVFTSGAAPIVITLRGSDVENDTLTFSIEGGPLPLQLANGVLSDLAPIVPDPVPELDENGNPTGNQLQPPTTSAFITYTPDTALDLEDSFVFTVTDPDFAFGMATVGINSPGDATPPPPPLTEVTARDQIRETPVGKIEKVQLKADAPDGVALTFSIISLPNGGLYDSFGQPIESTPYLLAGDKLTYLSSSASAGQADVFSFEAAGVVDGLPQTSQGSVTFQVFQPRPLAEDQSLTTNRNTPVDVTLTGNAGGIGSFFPGQRAGLGNKALLAKALPSTAVAGNVSDANGDGFGDGRDNLPGPAPVLVAAGVDVNLGPSSSASVTDPSGDATDDTRVTPDPDLVSATVSSDGTNLDFQVRFASGTFQPTLSRASFVLDTDQNPSTGFPGVDAANNDSALLGIEFLVDIGADLGANAEVLKFIAPPNSFSTVGTVAATVVTDGYDVSVPLSLLDGDDGRLAFKVTTQSFLGPGFTGILDYMPNLGLAPGVTGSAVQGVARVQIEWDLTPVLPVDPANVDSATVTLSTTRGTVDSLDTVFLVGTSNQDGVLAVSDFEAPVGDLVAVMPVPAGSVPGDEGSFTFDVTPQFKEAVAQGLTFFSVQGRVDESLAGAGFERGLQVRSTASGNLLEGKEPKLDVVATGQPPPLKITILSLPLFGTLLDKSTGLVVEAGVTFTDSESNPLPVVDLQYRPNLGYSGFDSFDFRVSQGLLSATAIVTVFIDPNDPCVPNGRDPGCAPGSP